jgi:hypothetical protein
MLTVSSLLPSTASTIHLFVTGFVLAAMVAIVTSSTGAFAVFHFVSTHKLLALVVLCPLFLSSLTIFVSARYFEFTSAVWSQLTKTYSENSCSDSLFSF